MSECILLSTLSKSSLEYIGIGLDVARLPYQKEEKKPKDKKKKKEKVIESNEASWAGFCIFGKRHRNS